MASLVNEMEIATNREPKLISLSCQVDDRGFLYQIFGNYEADLHSIKRVYTVGNFSKGVIRGFHMHKAESKAYFAYSGSAKFVAGTTDKDVKSFILTDRNPSVLLVPPKYYHGWISLEDSTGLIGLSDKTLEESISDDIRADPLIFGEDIWKVRNR